MLQDILASFISSNEWRAWARSDAGAELLLYSATAPLDAPKPPPEKATKPAPKPPQPPQPQAWDGWD